jgi:archaellum component FlaC
LSRIEKISKRLERGYFELPSYELPNDLRWVIAELERVNKLLHDLTPGGSEFYHDPDRCIENIKEQIEVSRRIVKQTIRDSRKGHES